MRGRSSAIAAEEQERFEADDGSLEYAKATGIYVVGVEAPLFPERVIAPPIRIGPDTLVIFAFGQSNAANYGEGSYTARDQVCVFNVFEMKYYRAVDPLPGATNDGAAVWGRLGDKLVDATACKSVIFVPIAVGASFIREWAPGGPQHRRLRFALHRLRMAKLEPHLLCWHQGEADANLTDMSATEYRRYFLSMLRGVRRMGIRAPVYVAVATLCATADHPFKNRPQIRLGQQRLVSIRRRIFPGPDTDRIGVEHRVDGCHFSRSGLELHAEAWFRSLTSGPLARWLLWAKYRLGRRLGLGES